MARAMSFDRIVVVDWSAHSTPKVGADSIWLAVDDRRSLVVENPATRADASHRLTSIVEAAVDSTTLIGVDFSLGYPIGTAQSARLHRPAVARRVDAPRRLDRRRRTQSQQPLRSRGGEQCVDRGRSRAVLGVPAEPTGRALPVEHQARTHGRPPARVAARGIGPAQQRSATLLVVAVARCGCGGEPEPAGHPGTGTAPPAVPATCGRLAVHHRPRAPSAAFRTGGRRRDLADPRHRHRHDGAGARCPPGRRRRDVVAWTRPSR